MFKLLLHGSRDHPDLLVVCSMLLGNIFRLLCSVGWYAVRFASGQCQGANIPELLLFVSLAGI